MTCKEHRDLRILEPKIISKGYLFLNPIVLFYWAIHPDIRLFSKLCYLRSMETVFFCCCEKSIKAGGNCFVLGRTEFITNHPYCSSFTQLSISKGAVSSFSELGDDFHPLVTQIRILLRLRAMANNFDSVCGIPGKVDFGDFESEILTLETSEILFSLALKLRSFFSFYNFEWNIQISKNVENDNYWRTIEFEGLSGIADPFIVADKTSNFVFFEGFKRRSEYGKIYSAEISQHSENDFKVAMPELVLDAGAHVSFPYIFKREDSWYLIPESSAVGKLLILQAEFLSGPWKIIHSFDFGFPVLDPVIIQEGTNLRLLGSHKIQKDCSLGYLLQSFTSTSGLEGPWVKESNRSLWSDKNGRLGGMRMLNGEIELFTQSGCKGKYGHHLERIKLVDLFRKESTVFMMPAKNKRIHHFSSNATFKTRDIFQRIS